ncbi:MAG: sensor histidine kinase [Muribaculaceae bacterium]|nr:sensor histidine kinase [Muribaculaceae bacterium]
MTFWEKWNKNWNFEKKMDYVIIWTITVIAVAAIVVSTFSFIVSVTDQNSRYVAEQLTILAEDYEDRLEQYKALATSIILDSHVQNYCESKTQEGIYSEMGNVYSTFLNMLYLQHNANFIAVTNKHLDQFVYNGNNGIRESGFETMYGKDYGESMQAKTEGSLRVSFSDNYYRGRKYTLTFYFPAYSVTRMVSSNGMIIVNFDDNLLQRFSQRDLRYSSNLYLTDMDGNIVSTQNEEEIGRKIADWDKVKDSQGMFWQGKSLISYRKVDDWNFYIISEVPAWSLYQNCFGTILVLVVVTLAATGVALMLARNITRRLYRPINKVVAKMNDVSQGDLGTRIQVEDMDSDGRKLADGFNIMMDEIDVLMERVKEEQRQFDKMRFVALQSQIQPHFLYNTLECIHWQALAGGNGEISTMVKALAQYYRICLSEGKEIITLAMELEHIRNYLIIQNMRYGNIITLVETIPEEYASVMIPKLTLQPLVENSIYHGIRVKEGVRGTVEIAVSGKEDMVCLTVSDNGVGMEQERIDYINRNISNTDRAIGYGITNINKRIELMYGERYGLRFRQREGGGVCVEIWLPEEYEEGQQAED